MFNSKRLAAFLVAVVVAVCAVIAVSAVGTDELAITVNSGGAYKLTIGLKNTSENYLANLDIKVGATSGGAKISSYGFDSGDGVRAVAPGESVSAFANLDPSSISVSTTKTPSPAQTTKPVQGNNQQQGGNNIPQNGGSNEPSYDNAEPVVPGVTPVEPSVDGSAEVSEMTSVHTIHSMAPGEETTLDADITDGSEATDETEDGTPGETAADSETGTAAVADSADDTASYGVWIAVGAVIVLGAAAAVVLIVMKKKKAVKDVASVIVIAVLLSALVSGEAATVFAADIKDPVAGSVSATTSLAGGNGTVTVTVTYTVVPKAQAEPLKGSRRVPPGDECDNANMNIRRIVPGAGPLTGHNIYVGDNGFFFFGQAIKDYTGASVMSNARLNKLVKMMNDRDEWAKENGIKLYLVIAPNKSTVYPEHVPDKLTAADRTNADAVVEALAAGSTVEVIDLRQTLVNAKSEYGDSLFYKYDTHWNNNGGFVAYTEMMRRISEDVDGTYTMKKSDYDIAEYETYMKDMAYYMGHYSAYTDYGPVYTLRSGMTASIRTKGATERTGQFRFCSMWKNGYSDAMRYVTFENTYNAGAPDVYMYRDSFSVSMLHFVKDSFNNSVFDWSYEFNKQEILNSGADVVIMEVVEKQLEEFTNSRTFS